MRENTERIVLSLSIDRETVREGERILRAASQPARGEMQTEGVAKTKTKQNNKKNKKTKKNESKGKEKRKKKKEKKKVEEKKKKEKVEK